MELLSGLRFQVEGETLCLEEPVHSAARSRRWRARGLGGGRYEVLFLEEGREGPLLKSVDAGACGWDFVRAEVQGMSALVFRGDLLEPFSALLVPPTNTPEARQGRMDLILALGDLFEMLHVVGEVMVGHAEVGAFAFRADREAPEAVMRWPELLYALDHPPAPGSFRSTGIDSPEVTGVIVRDVDARADVFLLGVLSWAILSGTRPSPGMERHVESLPLLRAFDPGIYVGVEACLRKAMARVPEARHESVTVFLEDLRRAWEEGKERLPEGADRPVGALVGFSTDIGDKKRTYHPVNQDALLSIWDSGVSWGIFSVMDGVSRCDVGAGELASWACARALEEEWETRRKAAIYGKSFEGRAPFPVNFVASMLKEAHRRVARWTRVLCKAGEGRPGDIGACTTASVLALFGDRAVVCAVGDSPVYLIRLAPEPSLERISVAQVASLWSIREGRGITEALEQPGATSLAMALGRTFWDEGAVNAAPLSVEAWAFRVRPGDLLLLTSDGIPDAFGRNAEHQLLTRIKGALDGRPVNRWALQEAAEGLIKAANESGGGDNLTALLIAIEEG